MAIATASSQPRRRRWMDRIGSGLIVACAPILTILLAMTLGATAAGGQVIRPQPLPPLPGSAAPDDPLSALPPIERARAIVKGSMDFLPNGMPSSGTAAAPWDLWMRSMSGGDRIFGDGRPAGANEPVNLSYFAPNPTLRYQPGSPFDPGASGPGVVSRSDRQPFLGGTFDPRSGWTVVILDHLKPNNARLGVFQMVNTYSCEQRLGLDTVKDLKLRVFSPAASVTDGNLADFQRLVAGRPVFIQIHGSLTYADTAVGGGWWSHTWLGINGALPEDAVFITFNWPSWRIYDWDIKDINEKGRRAFIAGLHLAQFLQTFPPDSRICLLGQSFGGRVAATAMHLLGGGAIQSEPGDTPIALPQVRPDLHIRCILLGAAIDRDWLCPGERLGRALCACEGLLNLYNTRDQALVLYRFLKSSGRKPALGRVGLSPADRERFGVHVSKYVEMDVMPILGRAHSLLDATSDAKVAKWIAPYAWGPGPPPDRNPEMQPRNPPPR